MYPMNQENLLLQSPFKIKKFEVYGYGGLKAEKGQLNKKNMKKKELEKRRKVNRKLLGDDGGFGPDKVLLELAGHTFHTEVYEDDKNKREKEENEKKDK